MVKLRYFLLFVWTAFTVIGEAYKVGLLLNTEEQDESDAIKRLADFTLGKLEDSTTTIQLQEQYHNSTYLSLMNSMCDLFEHDVVTIISASDSTLTAIQVNLASQFHIPLVAAVSTNPFLEDGLTDNFELRLSPSDVYQSRAIFAILKEYKWFQFSILASADNYGINSIVYLQYLASQDDDFSIRDVQHFNVKVDSSDSEDGSLFKKELELIRDSLAKVIVLNCDAKYAKIIFE